MTDDEQWKKAVAAVSDEFNRLSEPLKHDVRGRLEKIKNIKLAIHVRGEKVEGPSICASCGGECCATGKHHFTVVDLLGFLLDSRPLFVPKFSSGACPFLGDSGCLMEPAYRPYNCITFNCDRVDELIDPWERRLLIEAEQELRSCYEKVEELFDNSFMHGLLITCEHSCRDALPVLRGQAAQCGSTVR